MRRLKIPTLLGAFITLLDDRLGETIVLPLLPFLLEQFTTSATTLGFLTGTYAISQFASAPLIGAVSDRFGRKPIMITCVSGSVIGICLFLLALVIFIASKPISMGIEARRNTKEKNNSDVEESLLNQKEDKIEINSKNISDEIIKLNKLMNEGIITKDEYEKAKNKLLS